jgi:hypothetical protein
MTQPTPPSSLSEIRKDMMRFFTQLYFVWSKIKRPDFKTVDEAQNWYDQNEFVIGSAVENQVDILMQIISTQLQEAERRGKKDALEADEKKNVLRLNFYIGKDKSMYMDEITNGKELKGSDMFLHGLHLADSKLLSKENKESFKRFCKAYLDRITNHPTDR